MSVVPFGSLAKGDLLTYRGEVYTKVDKVKVSCCKFTNAVLLSDANVKIGIKDNESVQVLDK